MSQRRKMAPQLATRVLAEERSSADDLTSVLSTTWSSGQGEQIFTRRPEPENYARGLKAQHRNCPSFLFHRLPPGFAASSELVCAVRSGR